MKRLLIVSCVILLFFPGSILLAQGNAGIGLQLGEPTGLTAKFWTGSRNAVDATLGWNLISNKFTFQAGYLFHYPLQAAGRGSLSAYWGLGGALGGGSKDNEAFIFLAGRVPLGLEYMYRQISFYGELDPMLRLLPSIGLGLGAGIGFRFYP